jgi:hypothetical protein
MNRDELLKEAGRLISTDRAEQYGEASVNMAVAEEMKRVFWRGWLTNKGEAASPAFTEAMNMVITKLSRIACGQAKDDNFVDAAGYLAIAGELASPASVETEQVLGVVPKGTSIELCLIDELVAQFTPFLWNPTMSEVNLRHDGTRFYLEVQNGSN